MSTIARVKLRWSGFNGGPGFTVFHFTDFGLEDPGDWLTANAQAAIDRVDAYAFKIKAVVAGVVSLQTESEVELIESTNGELVGALSGVPDGPVTNPGGGGSTFAGPVGGVINWKTAGIRNGRRVRGRSFVVPMYSPAYQADGSLSVDGRAVLTEAASDLINIAGSPDMGVWARPTGPGATDGIWHVASGYSVPDMAAVLRSRRD